MRFMIFSEQGNRLLYDSETVVALSDRKLTGCRKSKCGNFQVGMKECYQSIKHEFLVFTAFGGCDLYCENGVWYHDYLIKDGFFQNAYVDVGFY